jgi:ABC-type branched-subunit amino acid transport system substrate-binding protein
MTRKPKRRDVIKGIGVAGVVGLAGCSGGDGGDGGSDGGASPTMTEGGDGSGGDGSDGSDGGSTGGGGGLEVNASVEDTQTDPNAGVAAANSLVNAGVPFVCGSASSGVNVPVSQQVFIPNQVVGCSPSSTALSVTNLEDDDYIFRTAPSDRLQGRVMAQVAAQRISAGSASTLFVNNDYGQQLSNRFSNVFQDEFDGTVYTQVAYNQGESSYTSVIQEALNQSPDVLTVIGYPEDGTQLFRDFYSVSDGSAEILVPDGLRDGALPAQVGNDMDNVVGTAPAAGGPNRDAFVQKFEDEYGESPGVFTSQSYDSVAIGILANAAAGENTGQAVRDQMRNIANPSGTEIGPQNFVEGVRMAANGEDINYQGASSATNFDQNGDPASAAYSIWEFEGADSESTSQIEVQNFQGANPEGAGPSADSIPGSEGRTIEVGILLPETGNLASVGGPMIQAAQLPAMEVNNADI